MDATTRDRHAAGAATMRLAGMGFAGRRFGDGP